MGTWTARFGAAAVVIPLLAIVLVPKRMNIPPHLLGHPAEFIPNLLTPEQGEALMALTKEFAEFPSNTADLKFYNTTHEHIGEAVPIGPNGTCSHIYLVPSRDRTMCHLPGRIDIGRHYITTGGAEGFKELPSTATARLLSFGRYMFNPSDYPAVSELFEAQKFQAAARSVCPANKPILDPFQFNFIIQAPGQTVAVHVDGVYFEGASRFDMPQWMLAVMMFSGLFQDRFVDQVQVVAYYHKWKPGPKTGGQFIWWNEANKAEPKRINPDPLAGSAVDGSKTVHAATVYQPSELPPMLDKSKESVLVFVGDDNWEIRSDGEVIKRYKTNDLRMTVVYRARCFESDEAKERFQNPQQKLSLEDVLKTLKQDMVKNRGFAKAKVEALEPLALAQALLDTYVKYPLPSKAFVPFNYCALTKLLPWTEHVLKYIC